MAKRKGINIEEWESVKELRKTLAELEERFAEAISSTASSESRKLPPAARRRNGGRRNRRLALATVVLAAAGFAARDWIREQYYLRKLESPDKRT